MNNEKCIKITIMKFSIWIFFPCPFVRLCMLTIQYNAMQCNAMQCNTTQCNAMQCNAVQCSTMQCNSHTNEMWKVNRRSLEPLLVKNKYMKIKAMNISIILIYWVFHNKSLNRDM